MSTVTWSVVCPLAVWRFSRIEQTAMVSRAKGLNFERMVRFLNMVENDDCRIFAKLTTLFAFYLISSDLNSFNY